MYWVNKFKTAFRNIFWDSKNYLKFSDLKPPLAQNLFILNVLDDRLELEAKVEAASDERHSLLERCLGAESELDRSRSTLVELRRKLDDSQAALQELGRENQSIQGG